MVYERNRAEAVSRVEALGLRVLAERIEDGEMSPVSSTRSVQLQRHEPDGLFVATALWAVRSVPIQSNNAPNVTTWVTADQARSM